MLLVMLTMEVWYIVLHFESYFCSILTDISFWRFHFKKGQQYQCPLILTIKLFYGHPLQVHTTVLGLVESVSLQGVSSSGGLIPGYQQQSIYIKQEQGVDRLCWPLGDVTELLHAMETSENLQFDVPIGWEGAGYLAN